MAGRTMTRRRRFRQWLQDRVSTECLNAGSVTTRRPTTLRFANNGIATRERFLSPPVIPKF